MNDAVVLKALEIYKERYGYTTNQSIDSEKLEKITKEIEDVRRASNKHKSSNSRRSNK